MADTSKNIVSVEGIDDGVEVSANHSPEVHALNQQAKQELANWLPQWGKKPISTSQTQEVAHKLREENQEIIKPYLPLKLPDEKNRIRNLMHIGEFCRKLNRILGFAADGGSRIFINTPPAIAGFDNTKMKGLFIKMRGLDMFTFHTDLPPGWKKICAVQVPYMSEWGDMNRDDRGQFKGWKYIGWRGQVLLRLILAGAITEEEAHNEFGVPQGVEVDREYHRILENWRQNGKRTN